MRSSEYHVRRHELEVTGSRVCGDPLLGGIQKSPGVDRLVSENKRADFVDYRCIVRADVVEVGEPVLDELVQLVTHYVATTHRHNVSTLATGLVNNAFIRGFIAKLADAGFSIIEPSRLVTRLVVRCVSEVFPSKNRPASVPIYTKEAPSVMTKILRHLDLTVDKSYEI